MNRPPHHRGLARSGATHRQGGARKLPLALALGAGLAASIAAAASIAGAASAAGAAAGRAATVRAATGRGAAQPVGGFPVTLATPAGPVTIAHRPARIISLSPSATEDLFAVGAGHRVVAVDADSNYPPSAPRTKLSGLTPNLEAIARYRPDLVVVSYDPALVKTLGALHIPVLYQPAPSSLAGAYTEISQLGAATGTTARARGVVASMRRQIAALVAAAPRASTAPSYFYELSASPYYSATSHTLIGSVVGLFRLRNIADAATGAAAAGGYPELSQEYILAADPQIIFLADTGPDGGQTAATVAKRAGWSAVSAVVHHAVFQLDPDIASRWGPRLTDLAATVERDLAAFEHHRA